ncbi:MAG: hypothetical protein ACRD1X_12600, partial [Vicinamibacteria bacterium]
YIIDEVHMLTTQAFNALLKTLEEPPPRVKFIFATTEYHKIPDTIVSRCQQFEFRTVPSIVIADQLRKIAEQEGFQISETALSQIARAAEGSLRDALSALDQVLAAVGTHIEERDVAELLGLIDLDILAATARAITDRDTPKVLSIVNDLVSGGRDLRSFARGLVQYFRDLLMIRVAPDLVELADDREELSEIANNLSEDDVIRSIDLLTQLEGALRWAPEPRFHLEVALLKLAQLRHLASFEDLLTRLEALESGGPPAPRSAPPVKASPSAPKPASTTKRAGSKPSTTTPSSLPSSRSPEPVEPSVAHDRPDAAELVARILDRLRTVNPKLHALLSHHDGVSLDGDCLRVGFDASQEFSRTELDREDLRSILAKAASECAGRTLRVEIASSASSGSTDLPGSPGSPEASGSLGIEPSLASELEPTTPPKRDALRDKVLKEPLVRSFLETFQGEIEDIRSLETSPEGQSSEQSDKR